MLDRRAGGAIAYPQGRAPGGLPCWAMRALLTDLYQFTMLQSYLEQGLCAEATFELFVRQLPPGRRFLVAAGLQQAIEHLEGLSFSSEELGWLEAQGLFSAGLIRHLRHWRFTGDVHAMPEGTVFFPDEPVLRVTAPLPQAQLVESRLLNLVHFQTLIASKAARCVLAARGRGLIDFGMRRAHGEEAALLAARAAWIAGFDGTATVEAGHCFGLPVFGTMAHSFVQAHASEAAAFAAFARARPKGPVLLVDTYDTEAAVATLIAMEPQLRAEGVALGGVRLDSGDLATLARRVRAMLDRAGLDRVRIIASGNLDEHAIDLLVGQGVPIDAFGVGTALATSSDAPALDAVYKLQSYDGKPRRKRSAGKATWPGVKQVWRCSDADGRIAFDHVGLADDAPCGRPLLQPVMRCGRRIAPAPSLAAVKVHAAAELASLTGPMQRLDAPFGVAPVRIADSVKALAAQVDAATQGEPARTPAACAG